LIYGADAMRIALKRQEVIRALIGPKGDEEMRLTRIPAGELRREPALALDGIKAVSFFPGPRAVFVEDATEQAADGVLNALEDWQPGDAQLIVTAGQLKPTSKIRKAFEAHPKAYAAAIYDDPPTREEIERTLSEAGIKVPDRDILQALSDLARDMDPGDFRQTMDKLALYKRGDATPISLDDILACAPASMEADLDDILHIVAEGRAQDLAPVLRRLQSQGTNAVSLTIAATRHFRALHAIASDPGGPSAGIGRVRPPIFGPRRDRMLRQAQGWGAFKLETALGVLVDTDLALRSGGQTAPQMALVERAFIRLAMLGQTR
jgi:DNA polymerase-3 subunit delta